MRTYKVGDLEAVRITWKDQELQQEMDTLIANHRPDGRAVAYRMSVRALRLVNALWWRLAAKGWRLRRLTDPDTNTLYCWVERRR